MKGGTVCNIPWPRCGGSLGGVRCGVIRYLFIDAKQAKEVHLYQNLKPETCTAFNTK